MLKPGDQIVSVDGVGSSYHAIRRSSPAHRCAGAQVHGCVASTPATIVVRRSGRLRPSRCGPYSAAAKRPLLGFEFDNGQQPVGAGKAASLTATGLWGVTKRTVR